MASKPLTPMQKRFALSFAVHENGALAAREAGYSEKSAKNRAQVLLNTPHVKALIKEEKARLLAERDSKQKSKDEQAVYTEQRIKRELAAIGFTTITDVCSFSDGVLFLKESSEISKEAASAIAEVTSTPGQFGNTVKIKLHPKMPALLAMMKELGMLIERHEITEKKAKVYMELVGQLLVKKGIDPQILLEVATEMEEMENA